MVEDRKTIEPIILMKGQDIIGIKWTSPKTSQKSLEQGVLWEIHPHTKKEIELSPKVFISSIVKKNGWYIAHLDEKNNTDVRAFSSLIALESENTHIKPNQPLSDRTPIDYGILSALHAIIKERKELLPEGSYTSHLFKSGTDKIKKKLGEETIELILSQSKDDIIHEGADLLYHLFVMLVNEDIDFQHILGELQDRYTT